MELPITVVVLPTTIPGLFMVSLESGCDTYDDLTKQNVGDYYFIKAGNELLSQGLVNCSNGQAPTAATPTTIPGSSQSGGAIFRNDLALIWPSLLVGLVVHLIGYM